MIALFYIFSKENMVKVGYVNHKNSQYSRTLKITEEVGFIVSELFKQFIHETLQTQASDSVHE